MPDVERVIAGVYIGGLVLGLWSGEWRLATAATVAASAWAVLLAVWRGD